MNWIHRWQSRRRLNKLCRQVNAALKKPPKWLGHQATIDIVAVRPSEVEPWVGQPEFIGRVKRSDHKVGRFSFTHFGAAPFQLPAAALSLTEYTDIREWHGQRVA
jgi:hypothetical protein